MAGNYSQDDPFLGTADLDDVYVSDEWLVEQFVGNKLYMWGSNTYGQLGDGTTTSTSTPIQIGSATNWKTICCNDYSTYAIKTDGTLWAWGYNADGQLGNGNTTSYSSPIQIGSLTNWSEISAARAMVHAIKTDGTLWSWGDGSAYGQIGNNTRVKYSSPVQVGSLTNWKFVQTGWTFVTAIKTDGTLWAWGDNVWGQLGNGNTTAYSSPIQIGSLTNWKSLALGSTDAAAIKTDGTLWTWGRNQYGHLGLGDTTSRSSPVQVGSLTDWKNVCFTINSGNGSTCAGIKTDGSLWTWGTGAFGELGYGGTTRYTPQQAGVLYNWKSLNVGQGNYQIAVKTDGTLWSWGNGGNGGLGTGSLSSTNSVTQVGTNTNWKVSAKTTISANFSGAITYSDF